VALKAVPPLTSFVSGKVFGAYYGSRPPRIVCLHGWGRDHHDFDVLLGGSVFNGQLDGLAIDLPGFGKSPPPPIPWDSSGYAGVVAEVIEEAVIGETKERGDPGPSSASGAVVRGGQAVVVLGHSFGGRVALALASSRPDLVRALILVGVPLVRIEKRPKAPLAYRLAKTIHRLGVLSPEAMERIRRRYGSADYRASQGIMRDVLVRTVNESYEQELQRLEHPVTLIWGSEDSVVPLAVAERASRLIRRSRLEVVEGADHYDILEAAGTRELVERLLAEAG
jgi:pimeloyl-ACP methyl ester carboxylesterase